MKNSITFDSDVDCLANGAPHAREARAFYDLFAGLSDGPEYQFIRCYVTFDLYQKSEALQEDTNFQISAYKLLLADAADMAKRLLDNQSVYQHKLSIETDDSQAHRDAEDATQSHYGSLFEQFDEPYYYDRSSVLLKERYFDRNGLEIPSTEDKIALDGGCGGGRFTLVLRQMGFKQVYGVDLSPANVDTAISRRDAKGIQDVFYEQGSVLKLPYPDNTFDFVLSNGVLHHTPSIPQGLSEISRVLKPGGSMLLYLMERPGGIALDTMELLRIVMRPVRQAFARQAMSVFGASGHRIYTLLDHTQVPISARVTPGELEGMLADAGFTRWQRLVRGLPYDKVEKLRRMDPLDQDAIWKYGVGENRYYCFK